jgi:uncharacterized glyoxalase superfamily protein PhnB
MFKFDSSFTVLYTHNLAKTYTFYEALGAEIIYTEQDKITVVMGDYELHFVYDDSEPIDEYYEVAKTHDRGGSVIFYVEVENIDEAFRRARSAGAKILADVAERPWELREFLFEDPNGYKIVFYEEV